MSAPAPAQTRRALDWPTVGLVGVVIAGVLAALWIVLTRTPPETVEKLLELNWGAAVLGATSLVLAVIGMLRRAGLWKDAPAPASALAKPWETPGYDDEDPTPAMTPRALDRRDRAPGDSSRPRRRTEGSTGPGPAIAMVVGALALALAIGLLSGCGASAVRIHATSATIATHAATAARAELLRAVDARIAACRALPEPVPCLDEAQRQATDAGIALDAAVIAIASYREAVEVAHLAEDQDVAGVVLARAKAHASEQWSRVLVLATALGADLPTSPDGGPR